MNTNARDTYYASSENGRHPNDQPTLDRSRRPPQLLELVEQVFHSCQIFVEGVVHQELYRGLTRSLLIAQVKLQHTVEQAIESYCHACEDYAEAEACLAFAEEAVSGKSKAKAREKLIAHVSELVVRFGRHRQYWREVLNEFDVAIDCVAVGDEYNPERHAQIGTRTSEDVESRNQVAEVERQRFTWQDEFGLEQSLPARVVVFD